MMKHFRWTTGLLLLCFLATPLAAQDSVIEALKKKADELNRKLNDYGFLDETPAAKPLEGFCAALEDIIVAGRSDFKSVQGPLEYSFYAVRVSIPGSGKCQIPLGIPDYSCTTNFRTRELADRQLAALARHIDECFPRVKSEHSADRYEISIPSEDKERKRSVSLITVNSLHKKWNDGVDEYYVSLSVQNVEFH